MSSSSVLRIAPRDQIFRELVLDRNSHVEHLVDIGCNYGAFCRSLRGSG